MGDTRPDREEEIERLRQALARETQECLELRRQLDEQGAEFEHFVSMAAHNLSDSLRDVASYSQILSEPDAPVSDADAEAFLKRIQEAAASMQSLLADVVDYWTTGNRNGQPSRIEMEAVLSQALLMADRQIGEQGAVVTHDPLPAVMGDFEILAKVLHHLIRNAIEYGGTPSPQVHISSRCADLQWVLSVKDNGPGIEPAFQARLFGAFKRLHGREYAGNGLGLAFCKKAVESQGGRVWMESSLGGSTFYFTAPAAD